MDGFLGKDQAEERREIGRRFGVGEGEVRELGKVYGEEGSEFRFSLSLFLCFGRELGWVGSEIKKKKETRRVDFSLSLFSFVR